VSACTHIYSTRLPESEERCPTISALIAAKDVSRLNILDLYLFHGTLRETAIMLRTSRVAGIFAPTSLQPEGIYSFAIDVNGNAGEEVAYKFKPSEVSHTHIHTDRDLYGHLVTPLQIVTCRANQESSSSAASS
jgi:hypothetical protein